MTGTVSELNLATATDSDDLEAFLTGPLTTDLGAVGGKFAAAGGHGHTGATGDAGRIGATGLAAGAATGAVLGTDVVARIANTTLGALAANIDLSSIPQTYAHLLLVAYLRGDTAAATAGALFQFNGDTTASYYNEYVNASGTTISGFEGLGEAFGRTGLMPAANSSAAGLFAPQFLLIPHYTGTGLKTGLALSFAPSGVLTGTLFTRAAGSMWNNGSAVNRLTVLPSAGNLVSGSRATLFGLG